MKLNGEGIILSAMNSKQKSIKGIKNAEVVDKSILD